MIRSEYCNTDKVTKVLVWMVIFFKKDTFCKGRCLFFLDAIIDGAELVSDCSYIIIEYFSANFIKGVVEYVLIF